MVLSVTHQSLSSFLMIRMMKEYIGHKGLWSHLTRKAPKQSGSSDLSESKKRVFKKVASYKLEVRRGLKHERFKRKTHTRKWSWVENPNSKSVKFK